MIKLNRLKKRFTPTVFDFGIYSPNNLNSFIWDLFFIHLYGNMPFTKKFNILLKPKSHDSHSSWRDL